MKRQKIKSHYANRNLFFLTRYISILKYTHNTYVYKNNNKYVIAIITVKNELIKYVFDKSKYSLSVIYPNCAPIYESSLKRALVFLIRNPK